MTISEKIIELRKKDNLTQKELADKMNINRSVLNRIELGTRPIRDDELKKLASLFGVTTDYLLGNNPPTPAQESGADAALLELLRKDDPEMQKILKNVHIDGTFTDGKRVCDLSPESITRIKDAIRVSFAIDGQKGRAVVEIDE